MRYLSHDDLDQRFVDVFSNLTVLSRKGQISLHKIDEGGEYWMIMWTHILEEYALRGKGLPLPHAMKRTRLPKPTFPNTPRGAHFCEALEKELEGKPYLVKYGLSKYLQDTFKTGSWRISAASTYGDGSLNTARRDSELERMVELMPEEVTAERYDASSGSKKRFAPFSRSVELCARISDYYVTCFSRYLHLQMFDDFEADCCIIIRDPIQFSERLMEASRMLLTGFDGGFGLVKYLDPLNSGVNELNVPFTKHFRYSYQREARFAWFPKTPESHLLPQLVADIGSLKDIAILVTIS